jgi:hypothetical protein
MLQEQLWQSSIKAANAARLMSMIIHHSSLWCTKLTTLPINFSVPIFIKLWSCSTPESRMKSILVLLMVPTVLFDFALGSVIPCAVMAVEPL